MKDATAVAEVLERAAEVIEERGWCQGSYYLKSSVDGEVCAIGAVMIASRVNDEWGYRCDLVNAAESAVCQFLDVPFVTVWNDAAERTQYEVIDALKHTAKDLRNEATA